jgi:hydroxymethylbilane synthase
LTSLLRLGTRGSPLALRQANTVAALVQERTAVACKVIVIKTSGDRLAEARLSDVGGKQLFVKEIEDALLNNRVDLAVHSSKDMPAILPDGLDLGAVLPREDPHDALIFPTSQPPITSIKAAVEQLGNGANIGTSSVRRTAQLAKAFPTVRFKLIRGNLETRLQKLENGDCDALVLAAAGLLRLGISKRISCVIPTKICLPAPGQGIIAVELRAKDNRVRDLVACLNDPEAFAVLTAERAVVRELGGGCQMPIGAHASLKKDALHLDAIVLSLDGGRCIYAMADGDPSNADALGVEVAGQLLAEGAADILAEIERSRSSVKGVPQ